MTIPVVSSINLPKDPAELGVSLERYPFIVQSDLMCFETEVFNNRYFPVHL